MNFLESTKSHGKSGGSLPLFRLQRTLQIAAAAPPELKSNSKPSQSSLDYRPELSAQDKDVKGRLARRAVSVGLSPSTSTSMRYVGTSKHGCRADVCAWAAAATANAETRVEKLSCIDDSEICWNG